MYKRMEPAAYLKAVRDSFQGNPAKYDEFWDVLNLRIARRISPADLRERLKKLFEGRDDLYLYWDYTARANNSPIQQFLRRVRARQPGGAAMFDSFVDLVNGCGNSRIAQLYPQVAHLFREHPDLLDEFARLFGQDQSTPMAVDSPPADADLLSLIDDLAQMII